MYQRIILHIFLSLCLSLSIFAQCPTQNIAGNFTATNGQILAGTYNITGIFYIPLGVTVFVEPYSVNTCGFLEINADSIRIEGTLSAVGAGFEGGTGGLAGFCTDSIRFQDCSLNSQCMGITPITFGAAGTDGLGIGFGNGGTNGTNGSGRKNSCNATSDRVGRVGGSGGGGGGAGGSYGGSGSNAGAGTAATMPIASVNSPNNTCAPANTVPFVAGNGGNGGIVSAGYGTATGNDWDLGSGGGGAAGGGRGYFPAQNGENGGNGGGAIKLISQKGLYISGDVLADGALGGKGGDGGDGGESARCCTDLCPQVNEHTYVGAGGGGAGGGGGSGGAIWIDAGGSLQILGLISANGGLAGTGGQGGAGDSISYQEPAFICGTASGLFTYVNIAPAANGNKGGSGGGGRIKIFFDNCAWNNFSGMVLADSGGLNATNGSIYWQNKPTTFAIGTMNVAQNPQTICAVTGVASPFTATPSAINFTPQYQWQIQPDCTGAWQNILGANSLTYTPSALNDTACFRLLVNSGNCAGIYPDTFQINTIPAPSYNLNLNSASFCAGNNASLSIVSPLPVGATIQWYQNGIPISAANGGNTSPLSVSTTGTYFATIASAGTCSGSTDTASITVFPLPNVSINPQSSTTFCAGGSVILTSSIGNTYQWFQNGNPLPNNSQSLTVTTSGNYTVQITDGNNCSATSTVVQVTVNPNPVANLLGIGSATFCAGGSMTLNISGGTSYSWFFNGAFNNNNTNIQVATVTGAYFAEVSNAFNCKDTSATINVTVNPLPNASILASNTSFCTGDSVMLVATGGGNYQWQSPISSNNDTIYVSQNGVFCVNVTDITTNCSTSVCSPQITQAINPNADIQTLDATTICTGDTVHFTTTASLVNQWLLNGNPILGATGQSFAATQAGIYSVIAIFSQNCRDTSINITLSTQNQANVTIVPLTATSLCNGDTILLTANGGTNYTWLTPSGNVNADTISVTAMGNYQVIGTNNGGTCPDTSLVISLNFFPLPVPIINIGSGTNPFCSGDSLALVCNGYVSYQWLKDGIPLVGETNSSLIIYNAGLYTVIVIDANGCEGIATGILVQTSTLNPPIITGDNLICANETTLLQATGNYTSYQWAFNGINISTNANINASQTGTYLVTVTFGSCVASSAPFVVNLAPKPLITIVPNDTVSACSFNFPIIIKATGASSYQWYKNNSLLGGQTNDTLLAANWGTYYVMGSNSEGCKDTSEKVVFVSYPSFVANIQTMGIPQICEGDSVALVASGGEVAAWLLNGQEIPNSAGKNPFYAKNEGEYDLVTIDSCGNDTTNTPVKVTYINIKADFSYSPTEIYTLDNVQFYNQSNITGNPQWYWDFGDGNHSINKNPRHIYTINDSFLISLIAYLPSGCTDTISKPIYVHTHGTLYLPNVFTPNSDGINDRWKADGIDVKDFHLFLYDRWGKIVSEFSSIQDDWDGTTKGKPAPEGVYTYSYQVYFYDGRSAKAGGMVTLVR